MKSRILWSFLLLTVLFVQHVWADMGGFHYENYEVSALVHKNNVWDITETIQVYFEEPRHGIYNYIPTQFSLYHDVAEKGEEPDLQEFDYYIDISDIEVEGADFVTTEDNGNKVIRLGSEDVLLEGSHTYVIRYRFTYPDDRIHTKDYLLHTLHGADFEQVTDRFHFDITLEKPIPQHCLEKMQLKMGTYGKTTSLDILPELQVSPTHISGTIDNLQPHQALTLDIPLPEGYYEGVKTVSPIRCWILYACSLGCLLLIFVLAMNLRHPDVVKQIEFYPPEGISSAEVGTIIDDSADESDLASLIPWLASQGYLKIKEVERRSLLSHNTVLQLTRIQDLPEEAPEYQKTFMKALFGKHTTVMMDKLEENPTLMHQALMGLGREFTGERKLCRWKATGWLLVLFIVIASHALWFSCPEEEYSGIYFLCAGLLYMGPMLTLMTIFYFASKSALIASRGNKLFTRLCCIFITVLCCIIWCAALVPYGAFLDCGLIVLLYALSYVGMQLTGRFNVNSEYRSQMMGKLLGLKEFIQTAELPRLESLLEEDPQYFYRLLPYALVFGLSDKWSKQFQNIQMQQPDWYQATDRNLNTALFTHHMTDTLSSSSRQAITTVSHDSSAASSSSGGHSFAGAGGGGGGGGSW